MTSKRRFGVECSCGQKNIKCPQCNKLLAVDTKFSQWIRQLPFPNDGSQASAQNLDYIWFRFYDDWFITIEEKTNGKEYKSSKSDYSQQQSHNLIKQMLEQSSDNLFDISFGNWKRESKVSYHGHYLIVFEKTNPDDSNWIKINGNFHSKFDLLILLQFGALINLKNEIRECQTNDPHTEICKKYEIDIPWIYIILLEDKIAN